MEAVRAFETPVSFYQTTRCVVAEGANGWVQGTACVTHPERRNDRTATGTWRHLGSKNSNWFRAASLRSCLLLSWCRRLPPLWCLRAHQLATVPGLVLISAANTTTLLCPERPFNIPPPPQSSLCKFVCISPCAWRKSYDGVCICRHKYLLQNFITIATHSIVVYLPTCRRRSWWQHGGRAACSNRARSGLRRETKWPTS
jgi:hypothetical protein